MRSAPRASIGRKLTAMVMLTTTCAVVLASLGYLIVGLRAARSQQTSDLTTLASVISDNASASILFGERESAKEVLQALRAKPSIITACIYTKQGKPFVRYGSATSVYLLPTLPGDGFHERGDRLELFYPIRLNHERIGTLYMASDFRDRNARLKQYALISAGIVLISLFIAFVVSSRLQRSISAPIIELGRVASLVSRHKTFSVRTRDPGARDSEEVGNLMTGFNDMLSEIEQRDDRLLLHQAHLEETVAKRTSELLGAKNAAEGLAERNGQLARESALILNSATDGIIGIGLDNRATFLNPAASRILGLKLEDLCGKTIHEAIHHSHPDGTPWPEADCACTTGAPRGEALSIAESTFWRVDGTTFPVEFSSTPMFDEHERQLGAVLMFRDATERRAIERLKSEFVSTVSHELRTPLTSIRGALGLLASGKLGPFADKAQRMLAVAVGNTDRLVRLINDILDLERIDSGKVELVRRSVDANTLMVQALEGVQSMADQVGVRLVIAPASGILLGDSDRLIQTLTNLLSNAIKFSPPDTTVTLSGTARAVDFLFCVTDQGRGVPEQKLESIFERFSQVNASDSRDRNGTGLGLAISRSIVTAHGGRIWAERNEPAGSRFQFTIPLAVPSAVAAPAIGAATSSNGLIAEEHGIGGAAPSILVVEDDLDLARVMTTCLESHGIRTFHAVTGSEAIELCRRHEPSMVVLDLTLPDMDGFAVVRSLRESTKLGQTPLLVYSAQDVGSADQSRLRLGPTKSMTKSRCGLVEFEKQVIRLLGGLTNGMNEGKHAA